MTHMHVTHTIATAQTEDAANGIALDLPRRTAAALLSLLLITAALAGWSRTDRADRPQPTPFENLA